MRVREIKFDRHSESAYVYLEKINPGDAVEQVVFPGGMIFDLGDDGRLLGIEILNPSITKDLRTRKMALEFERFEIPFHTTG